MMIRKCLGTTWDILRKYLSPPGREPRAALLPGRGGARPGGQSFRSLVVGMCSRVLVYVFSCLLYVVDVTVELCLFCMYESTLLMFTLLTYAVASWERLALLLSLSLL